MKCDEDDEATTDLQSLELNTVYGFAYITLSCSFLCVYLCHPCEPQLTDEAYDAIKGIFSGILCLFACT